VSLADLDIITRFCESPDVFLHYIERRLELQRSGKNILGDELDLFGTYLDSRLEPSLFWNRKTDDGETFDMMWISGGSERFDEWHDAKIGVRDNAPKIQLAVPPHVKDLLAELRNRDDDGARWIAFALLNLTRNGVDRFEHLLTQVREHELQPGNLRSAVFVDESLVGVISVGRMVGTTHLRQTLYARLIVEKYRRKLDNAFGFAIELNDPFKPFDSALWAEGEWIHEPEIERVISMMPPLNVAPGRKLPNSDEDCLCGSGKKFKDCCLPFFKIK
jgi:SEC-C motif